LPEIIDAEPPLSDCLPALVSDVRTVSSGAAAGGALVTVVVSRPAASPLAPSWSDVTARAALFFFGDAELGTARTDTEQPAP
jgi:hypothetical protein